MASLEKLMEITLRYGGAQVSGGAQDVFMEVREVANGKVWMCMHAVSQQDFKNLQPGDEFEPVLVGTASMDAALFQYSPGATSSPVNFKTIDGYPFAHVATPLDFQFPEQTDAPAEATVDKAHVIGFRAGRTISVMHLNGETFVEVVGDSSVDAQLVLPDGARLEESELSEAIVVSLPTPTRAFFWFKEGRSFQGPVLL